MTTQKTITLGQLKQQIAWVLELGDDTLITFGAGDLSFNRAKTRLYKLDNSGKETSEIVNIEFNQIYSVALDPDNLE